MEQKNNPTLHRGPFASEGGTIVIAMMGNALRTLENKGT
jgi:hypothetical protein